MSKPRLDSEHLFRLMVANIRDYAIFMLDPDGRIATWNAGAERITGYKADEAIGKHFSIFYPQVDIDIGKCEHVLAVAEREGRFDEEGWRLCKDGTPFWASCVFTAVRDESGALLGYSKITRDLTERKRAQDALERHLEIEETYRLIIESVRDYAIFMLDATGHVVTWNAGAERIKGYRAEEIIGSHFSRFYPEEDLQSGKCEMELRVATSEGRFEDEGWRVRKDGSRFWANVVISAVRNRHGQLVGFSKVTRDLTERMQADEERAKRLAAEQASRTKDEFLAMLGHELRNPMAPIVTALQLLKLKGDVVLKEHEIIKRQVDHMMHLVDDLLDVSRIAKGKLDLRRKQLDLRAVLGKAIEIASPLFEQHNHHFFLDAPNRPLIVDGDEARLIQVFANLLTNAAKYTAPGGHIRVQVAQPNGEIVVDVIDDGAGIDEELLPRVFDLFVQGYRGIERSAGGLGIGLTLVHQLVTLHGGKVSAHSEGRGKGSQFTVRLPAVELPIIEKPAQRRTDRLIAVGQPRRILLVDDNEDALALLAEALIAAGHDVRTAGDSAEALRVLEGFQPELAILDIGLPVMDGYELAQRIREQLPATPRMFALTGYGTPDDRQKSREAGFVAHFVKPVDVKQLIEQIAEPETSAN